MPKQSFENGNAFCENILSPLLENCILVEYYFIDGKLSELQEAFDYKILVITPNAIDIQFPCHYISSAQDISFLECLLLREVIKNIDDFQTFVFGARFGARVNRGANGKILSSLEVLLSKDNDLMDQLLRNLANVSPRYLLFDDIEPIIPPFMIWDYLKGYDGLLRKEESLDDEERLHPNDILRSVIEDIGIGRLLTLPELYPKTRRRGVSLGQVDASRILLMQNAVKPPSRIRPTINPNSIIVPWTALPARLFTYGPILDLISAYISKGTVKLCLNCGKLFRPRSTPHSDYLRKKHVYCSRDCQRSAQVQRYQRGKKQRPSSVHKNPKLPLKNN